MCKFEDFVDTDFDLSRVFFPASRDLLRKNINFIEN